MYPVILTTDKKCNFNKEIHDAAHFWVACTFSVEMHGSLVMQTFPGDNIIN